jgi:hypothetical protein
LFSRDNGLTEETGVGDIMVTTNTAGLSVAWIQFRDDVNGQWVRVYLNAERVRLLKRVENDAFDFVIEPTLDSGPEVKK